MKVGWVGMDAGIIVRIKFGHDGQEQTHWGGWSQEENSSSPPVEQSSAAGSKVEEHKNKRQGRRIRLIEGQLREYW